MRKRICPEHKNTGITPHNTECHSHQGNLQQRLHNAHCRILKCPYALRGKERHHEYTIYPPRNGIERLLLLISLNRKS